MSDNATTSEIPPGTGEGRAEGLLTERAPALTGQELSRLLDRYYNLSGTSRALGGERDQNVLVSTNEGRRYVLKIANTSEPVDAIVLQHEALEHMARTAPELPLPRVERTVDGQTIVKVTSENTTYLARLVTYLPGKPAIDLAPGPDFLRDLARLLANMDIALKSFRHRAGSREMIWDLCNAGKLEDKIVHLEDPAQRTLAKRVMSDFRECTEPALSGLRRQIIHNDINQNNIMRDPLTGAITGIIDFGDMIESCLVNEVAIAIAHQLYRQPDILGVAGAFVAAYCDRLALMQEEKAVLFGLVKMRLLVREIIAAWRETTDGGASNYRKDISRLGWQALERAVAIDPNLPMKQWSKF